MEHADTAQLAAVGGALGSALLLLARGRWPLLAGLALLALSEAGLLAALGLGGADRLFSLTGAVAAAVGAGALAAGAAALVRWPELAPLAILVAAPIRPPLDFSASNSFFVSVAEDGALGRLLPLYFVLAAAALALAYRVVRGEPVRTLPRVVSLPAAAFFAFAFVSLLWAQDLEAGTNLVVFFTVPFAVLFAAVGRSPFPAWLPRALGAAAVGLAALFAAVGLWQAATHELFFFAPNLEVSNANTDYFRVTSLFGDPSLYGRHLVLGIGILLAVLAAGRLRPLPGIALLALLWAGLLFSYSQSSMVALVVVILAVALAAGDRRVRRGVGALALVAVVAAAGFLGVKMLEGDSLSHLTSDRSDRIEDTVRVIEEHPVTGVGIGSQPRASRELAGSDRPTPSFVSHTTPLTVAAELGVIGLALYVWLLVGGARAIAEVLRRNEGLGLALGASFLGLFAHALFYSGFLEDPITWVVLGVAAGWLASVEASTTPAERAQARRATRRPEPIAP
jgi:O-antigen ligase